MLVYKRRTSARLLTGFGCTVLHNKRSRLADAMERELGFEYAELPDSLARADYVRLAD